MLTRENQMLKVRIRELERQIVELGSAGGQDRRRSRDGSSVAAAAAAGLQNSPVHHSGLTAPPITRADSGAGMTVGNGVAGQERGAAVEKDEVMN